MGRGISSTPDGPTSPNKYQGVQRGNNGPQKIPVTAESSVRFPAIVSPLSASQQIAQLQQQPGVQSGASEQLIPLYGSLTETAVLVSRGHEKRGESART